MEQQAVIERLERRIETLEGQAKPGGPPRMPGLKPSSGRQPTAPRKPRKQRPHGFARPRLTPTHRVEHVVESCPDCGTHLTGGWTQRTREVIELPVVPVQVTQHVFIARTCPVCRRRRVPTSTTGRRGTGAPTPGRQRAQPHRHVAGRRAPADPQRPVVSAHRPSVATERWRHRERHPSHGTPGPTDGSNCWLYVAQSNYWDQKS